MSTNPQGKVTEERTGSRSEPRRALGVTPGTGMKQEVESWAIKIGSGVQGGVKLRSLKQRQGCQVRACMAWWHGTEVVRGLKVCDCGRCKSQGLL